MSEPNKESVVHGEVLPPETRTGLRMPDGTPLGLGFLGAMRFDAIRRVLDSYERALRGAVAVRDAEAEHNNALARRAVSHEQLMNLDTIRAVERKRILAEAAHLDEEANINKLRRTVERLELEEKVIEREGRLQRAKAKRDCGAPEDQAGDDFTAFMSDLKRMPEMVKAVQEAKAQIIREAGGEDKLSEAQRQACDVFDSMLQTFMSKKAGESAL